MCKRLLAIALLLCAVPLVHAHDPGFSRASVQVHATGIAIQMMFARQDIELLVPLDSNHDGAPTMDEHREAQFALRTTIAAAIDVRGVHGRLEPESVRIQTAPSDLVIVALYYEHSKESAVRLHLPLLAQLARGHRHYLIVQDANGKLLARHILHTDSPPIVLQESFTDAFNVFRQYLGAGMWHIWIGFDHILFLLTLLLPAVVGYGKTGWLSQNSLRAAFMDLLQVVTAFTIAHSITLALAVLHIVSLPPRLVEAVIAGSVLVAAVNNLRPVFPASRSVMAFAFGLVHGFGFAGVLLDLGLPADALNVSLLGFNLGVEVGQLAIVLLVFPVAALLRHTPLYRTWLLGGGSTVAALIAVVWMFERVFDHQVLGF